MIDLLQKTDFDTANFDDIKNTCLNCTKCKLHSTRTNVVFGDGPTPCSLMAIGEGPGEKEDLQGIPFIGRAGQLLTKIFESVGINREKDLYITNIVKCRPPNNRDPEKDEISACNHYLVRQIQLIQPRILILIGAPALKTIVGNNTTISKARGKWLRTPVNYMDDDLYIMPIFHPSYFLIFVFDLFVSYCT